MNTLGKLTAFVLIAVVFSLGFTACEDAAGDDPAPAPSTKMVDYIKVIRYPINRTFAPGEIKAGDNFELLNQAAILEGLTVQVYYKEGGRDEFKYPDYPEGMPFTYSYPGGDWILISLQVEGVTKDDKIDIVIREFTGVRVANSSDQKIVYTLEDQKIDLKDLVSKELIKITGEYKNGQKSDLTEGQIELLLAEDIELEIDGKSFTPADFKAVDFIGRKEVSVRIFSQSSADAKIDKTFTIYVLPIFPSKAHSTLASFTSKTVTAPILNGGPFNYAGTGTAGVTVPPFSIGQYEITYELWDAVGKWANQQVWTQADVAAGTVPALYLGKTKYVFSRDEEISSGSNMYKFQTGNPGTQDITTGTIAEGHPVTSISWLDAAVWCNAYTELINTIQTYGLTGEELDTIPIPGEMLKTGTPIGIVYTGLTNSKTPLPSISINRSGGGYRLPTEAEWEFAARGGNPDAAIWRYNYSGSNNVNEAGWFRQNTNKETQPVGATGSSVVGSNTTTTPSMSIFDMTGNVWEWCEPVVSVLLSSNQVTRGGACDEYRYTGILNSADNRSERNITERFPNVGFRIAKN